jgi:hypothetical protein
VQKLILRGDKGNITLCAQAAAGESWCLEPGFLDTQLCFLEHSSLAVQRRVLVSEKAPLETALRSGSGSTFLCRKRSLPVRVPHSMTFVI